MYGHCKSVDEMNVASAAMSSATSRISFLGSRAFALSRGQDKIGSTRDSIDCLGVVTRKLRQEYAQPRKAASEK